MMDKYRIHEMLECITETALSELKTKGACQVDTTEMGAVIDMVKDLAEAEKSVWEKCYYKSIVEAMEDEEKYEQSVLKDMIEKYGEADGRLGYDRWRRSSGRFAPKGEGHRTSMAEARGRTGFMPDERELEKMPWQWPYDMWGMYNGMLPMGYTPDGRQYAGDYTRVGDGRSDSDSGRSGNRGSIVGYHDAKQKYRATGSPEAKKMMDENAKMYLGEAMDTMKDIFTDADPELQKKIKDDLFRLCREFGITKM